MTSSYVPPPRVSISHADDHDEPVDAWGVAESIVTGWRILVAIPLLLALAAGAATFLVPIEFTSITSFVTASREQTPNLGGFASVASQLGVGLASSPSNSPQFYAEVLRSREVVEDVLRATIPASTNGSGAASMTVLDLYERPGARDSVRLDRGVTTLLRESTVAVNPRTSIVELRVSSVSPTGSAFIAKQFLTVLNRFNLEKRQSQAGARRRFLGMRLAEAQDSLSAGERALQVFLEANRQFKAAPALQAQYDGIQRRVNTYQELYSNFRREFESARVDEVNDTPVITVIDTAAVSVRRSSPRRLTAAIVGGMLGAFFAVAFLVLRASLHRLRNVRPRDYERLLELRRLFVASLRPARFR